LRKISPKTIAFRRIFFTLFIKKRQRFCQIQNIMEESNHNNPNVDISSMASSMMDAEMPSPSSSMPIDLSIATTSASTSLSSSSSNYSQSQQQQLQNSSMEILNSLNSFPHISQPSTSQIPAFPQLNELLYSTLLQSGQRQVLGERLVNSCFDEELSQILQSAAASSLPPSMQQPPVADSVFWEHWMCLLATNLTPAQWQAYWQNYASMFGLNSLPLHLFSFFNNSSNGNGNSSNGNGNFQQQQNNFPSQIYRTESQQLADHERCKVLIFFSKKFFYDPSQARLDQEIPGI
jgi:hypothetical protein